MHFYNLIFIFLYLSINGCQQGSKFSGGEKNTPVEKATLAPPLENKIQPILMPTVTSITVLPAAAPSLKLNLAGNNTNQPPVDANPTLEDQPTSTTIADTSTTIADTSTTIADTSTTIADTSTTIADTSTTIADTSTTIADTSTTIADTNIITPISISAADLGLTGSYGSCNGFTVKNGETMTWPGSCYWCNGPIIIEKGGVLTVTGTLYNMGSIQVNGTLNVNNDTSTCGGTPIGIDNEMGGTISVGDTNGGIGTIYINNAGGGSQGYGIYNNGKNDWDGHNTTMTINTGSSVYIQHTDNGMGISNSAAPLFVNGSIVMTNGGAWGIYSYSGTITVTGSITINSSHSQADLDIRQSSLLEIKSGGSITNNGKIYYENLSSIKTDPGGSLTGNAPISLLQ